MSNKKKRTKFKFKFLILLIIIYIIVRAFPTMVSGDAKTMISEKEILVDSIKSKAYILKKENVYTAINNGILQMNVGEGERVQAGAEVGVLTSVGDDSSLREELKQVEISIEEIEKAESDLLHIEEGADLDSIKEEIKDDIQESIMSGDLDRVKYLRENLLSINELENPEEGETRKESLEKLKNKRENIIENISKNIHKYYIPDAGLISMEIDGYEELWVPEDFERYTYEFFEESQAKEFEKIKENKDKKYDVEVNQPIFKWIDNFEWYLCIKIDDLKTIKDIEENRVMTIKFNNGELMDGRVEIINKFKNRGVVVLKFTSKLHEYYKDRIVDVELIKSQALGYKVPKSALLEEEGKTGIRIRDLSGIIRYRPVIVVGKDEENYYLDPGDENSNIQINKKYYKTLTDFDEVVIKPNSVREGEILN